MSTFSKGQRVRVYSRRWTVGTLLNRAESQTDQGWMVLVDGNPPHEVFQYEQELTPLDDEEKP